MHLSMHNWMRAEPIEVTIRRLAKYGYESIEISGEPEKYDTKEVRQLLDAYGLRCWGSVTLMFAGLNFPSADEATRERTVKYVKDCITMVKELEGEVMTIVPGTVGKVNADSTPEKEWAWAVEGLKEVYAYGQQAGVRLALEPLNRFETYFISRGDAGAGACRGRRPGLRCVSRHLPPQHRRGRHVGGHPQGGQPAGRLPRRRQQPPGLRHGRAQLERYRAHAQGHRLR